MCLCRVFFFFHKIDNILWGSCCHSDGDKRALCAHLSFSFPPLLTSFFSISLEGVSMATRERFGDGVGVLKLLSLEIGQFSPSLSLSGPAKRARERFREAYQYLINHEQ